MTTPPPRRNVQACVFDAYGTLFDFGSAAAACRDVLGENTERLVALWRDKQLQYTWLLAAQGRHTNFWTVTGDALDFAMEALDLARLGIRRRLMDLYMTPAAFPDVTDTLRVLKAAGMRIAILSNGTPQMLSAAVRASTLDELIDEIISVEEVGVFKPHPAVYRRALDRLGVDPAQISFQSSNGWDICGASAFGLRTVWCNRNQQPRERLPGRPDHELTKLTSLPALLGLG